MKNYAKENKGKVVIFAILFMVLIPSYIYSLFEFGDTLPKAVIIYILCIATGCSLLKIVYWDQERFHKKVEVKK